MDKAIKIPLIALSVLTTQLAMLLGNTTISKSAEHKPTGNNHKEISQTYYDRQMKIESMPVMIEQEKQTGVKIESLSGQYEREEQSEKQRRIKCDQQAKYYSKIGYTSGTGSYFIGEGKRVFNWNIYDCEANLKGYLDIQVMEASKERSCDSGQHCIEWKLESNELCQYYRYAMQTSINRTCFKKN